MTDSNPVSQTTGFGLVPTEVYISCNGSLPLKASQWAEIERDERMKRIEAKLDELLVLMMPRP